MTLQLCSSRKSQKFPSVTKNATYLLLTCTATAMLACPDPSSEGTDYESHDGSQKLSVDTRQTPSLRMDTKPTTVAEW
jgi:hypothetical protein